MTPSLVTLPKTWDSFTQDFLWFLRLVLLRRSFLGRSLLRHSLFSFSLTLKILSLSLLRISLYLRLLFSFSDALWPLWLLLFKHSLTLDSSSFKILADPWDSSCSGSLLPLSLFSLRLSLTLETPSLETLSDPQFFPEIETVKSSVSQATKQHQTNCLRFKANN